MSKKDSPICESCGGELDEERVCCNLLCEMYYPPNNKPQPQTDTPIEAIEFKAEFLFEFSSFDKWVNKGQSWFKPYNRDKVICLDKNGHCCNIGEDFMAARDNELFPVKAYRLIRTIEYLNPQTHD